MKTHLRINSLVTVVLLILVVALSAVAIRLQYKIIELEERSHTQVDVLKNVLVEIRTLNITVKTGKTNLTTANIKLISERLASAELEVDKLVQKYDK